MNNTMKKRIAVFLLASGLLLSSLPTQAQEISGMTVIDMPDGTQGLADADGKTISDGFAFVSDFGGFPYAVRADGSKVLFDVDGSVLLDVPSEFEVSSPARGLYAAYVPDDVNFNGIFRLYDYDTKQLLFETNGFCLLYDVQLNDKLFIRRGSKFAVISRNGELLTDFVYDTVIKTFNPNYEPFPHSYAVVTQNGVKKYLDTDLNEIDLNNYNGEIFITNAYPLYYYNLSGQVYGYRIAESGDRYGLYDLLQKKLVIPFEFESCSWKTDGTYIIFENKDGTESGVMDFGGQIILPLEKRKYAFTGKENTVSFTYTDEEGALRTLEVNLLDKTIVQPEKVYGENMLFYQTTPFEKKSDVADITIVYPNGTCAVLDTEDRDKLLDLLWNFSYDRVISYAPTEPVDAYFLLRNRDRSVSFPVISYGNAIVGTFGNAVEGENGTMQNCVWYCPYIGNAKNAIYTLISEITEKYGETETVVGDTEKMAIPNRNMLSLDGASEWAKSEIDKAASRNILPYELTDHYGQAITRYEFCKLAAQLIKVDVNPKADSRTGASSALWRAAGYRYDEATVFDDCPYTEVTVLAALGIVNGVGDGMFAPERTITREEAATILYRLGQYRLCVDAPQSDASFADYGNISEWARTAASAMAEKNIMKGVSENEFAPKGTFTVEQAIATVVRMSDYPSGVDYSVTEY